MLERIGRGVRRRQHFDVESLVQRARSEFGRRQQLRDQVVDAAGAVARERLADPKHVVQLVVQPHAGRCRPERVVAAREELPNLTRIALDRPAVESWNSQRLE